MSHQLIAIFCFTSLTNHFLRIIFSHFWFIVSKTQNVLCHICRICYIRNVIQFNWILEQKNLLLINNVNFVFNQLDSVFKGIWFLNKNLLELQLQISWFYYSWFLSLIVYSLWCLLIIWKSIEIISFFKMSSIFLFSRKLSDILLLRKGRQNQCYSLWNKFRLILK